MDDHAAPSAPPSSATFVRARWGVGLVFFVNGAAFASWVSRIPALRAGLELGDGALGSVLFAMSCGVLLSFPLAGKGAQLLGGQALEQERRAQLGSERYPVRSDLVAAHYKLPRYWCTR